MESTDQASDATATTQVISQPLSAPSTEETAPQPTAPQKVVAQRQRRHWALSAFFHVLGLLVGVALGVVLTVGYLVWLTPSAQPTLPNTSAATGPGTISITVDDAFLTTVTQTAISSANTPVPITNVHAHILAGDSIVITGQTPPIFFFGPGHFSATAQPVAHNGRLGVHLIKGSLGGINAPTQVLKLIEANINQQLGGTAFAPIIGNTQYVVVGVTTTAGHMTLTLQPQRAAP